MLEPARLQGALCLGTVLVYDAVAALGQSHLPLLRQPDVVDFQFRISDPDCIKGNGIELDDKVLLHPSHADGHVRLDRIGLGRLDGVFADQGNPFLTQQTGYGLGPGSSVYDPTVYLDLDWHRTVDRYLQSLGDPVLKAGHNLISYKEVNAILLKHLADGVRSGVQRCRYSIVFHRNRIRPPQRDQGELASCRSFLRARSIPGPLTTLLG